MGDTITDLSYPDFLSLNAMPDALKSQALEQIDKIEKLYKNTKKINFYRQQILNNYNQHLFKDTLNHVLLLDNIRGENLFQYLPFRTVANQIVFYQ